MDSNNYISTSCKIIEKRREEVFKFRLFVHQFLIVMKMRVMNFFFTTLLIHHCQKREKTFFDSDEEESGELFSSRPSASSLKKSTRMWRQQRVMKESSEDEKIHDTPSSALSQMCVQTQKIRRVVKKKFSRIFAFLSHHCRPLFR